MWRLLPRVNINASILKKSPQVATKLARTITTNYQSLAWKPKNFKIHSGFAVNNTLLSYAVSLHNNTLFFARKYSTVPTENTPNKSQTSDTGAKQEQTPVEGSIPVEGTQTGQPIGNIFQNQENKDNNNNTNQEQEKTQRTIVSTTGPLEVAIRVSNWDHVRNVFSALLWIVLIYLIFFSKETPFSSFTASPAKEAQSEKTRLSDVKGNEEAKEELEDVILYLKETQRFINLGVKPPKGLLFVGPPGCGKTLLAKALAGEAGIPFFYTSGAEFEEMFVGVGAGRVRKLFQKARSGQGAIIFIDEIDAIGSRFDRDSSGKAGKMTLNQLLVEMDGFKPNDKVVVIAATNAPQVLDPALIRPGRFDRTVSVSLPQLQARKDIIELYLNDRAAPDVDIEKLARSTTGYSGADLFSMVNGAGIRAVKAKLPFITMSLLEKAKEDVALGPQRKSSPLSTEMKKLTAFHESGHALVALHASAEHEIDKATLIPRSKALGYVRFNRNEENPLYSKEYLRNDIAIAMGGRAAEEIIFGADKVTPGASSDIEKATDIAESMVMDYGMSDKVGHQHISKEKLRMAASETKMLVDSEIKRILEEEYVRAKSILTTNKQQLHRLAESLIEYEELSLEEIKIVINGGDISQRKLEEEEQRKQHQQQSEQAFEKQQAEKLAELQQAAAKFNQNKKSSVNNFVEEIVSKFNRLSGLGW